jgi:hypothetical protein
VVVVTALFAALLAVGVRSLGRDRIALALVLPWLCGPPLLVFLTARLTSVTYEVRYTLAALPAFLLLVALGVEGLGPQWRRAAGAGVLACFLVSLAN